MTTPLGQGVTGKAASIVGAGPAGLVTAILLAQRGWQAVQVYDKEPAPSIVSARKRSYQLGLNGRGQKTLTEFGVMERINRYAIPINGRLSFSADGSAPKETRLAPPETGANYVTLALTYARMQDWPILRWIPALSGCMSMTTGGGWRWRVIQRDRLKACLLEEIKECYAHVVTVNHEVSCVGVDLTGDKPALCLQLAGAEVRAPAVDLVVGADGMQSAVRAAMANDPSCSTRTERFADSNERLYKTLLLHAGNVPGISADLNWGYYNRTADLGLDALPTKEGRMVSVMLVRPGTAVSTRIQTLRDAREAREFIRDCLPSLLPYVVEEELEIFARSPIRRLPPFQLVHGDLHALLPKGGVVLLGDAVKTVKPYFGQGCNSALEDVSVLARCLARKYDSPRDAVADFTATRAADVRALVSMSRSFDRPGW
eukprot:CAMPEP_0119302456 /NCGR_PEP_ID=MMETSP1333-20130426/4042_1 /TAXON_ID=418940 /ORGANISM="Scyphosphaera apsteinii, Strain RCC1455" /LENGTH=428 /DNA_ID=CAMNT_0007304807 /DNA_START=99 /DNA_END=1382 /DNA_ORIENTATION=+